MIRVGWRNGSGQRWLAATALCFVAAGCDIDFDSLVTDGGNGLDGQTSDASQDGDAAAQECDRDPDCGVNAWCRDGRCDCEGGYANCDSELGCETALQFDDAHCGGCDEACSDGTSCVEGECITCSDAGDCLDDGLDCTGAPMCDDGICHYPLAEGQCLIDGRCYEAGARPEESDCLECRPSQDPESWTVRMGESCDEAECASGTCGADGRCEHSIEPGWCFIEGECFGEGTRHPDYPEPCQGCDPARSAEDWSDLPDDECPPDCGSLRPVDGAASGFELLTEPAVIGNPLKFRFAVNADYVGIELTDREGESLGYAELTCDDPEDLPDPEMPRRQALHCGVDDGAAPGWYCAYVTSGASEGLTSYHGHIPIELVDDGETMTCTQTVSASPECQRSWPPESAECDCFSPP